MSETKFLSFDSAITLRIKNTMEVLICDKPLHALANYLVENQDSNYPLHVTYLDEFSGCNSNFLKNFDIAIFQCDDYSEGQLRSLAKQVTHHAEPMVIVIAEKEDTLAILPDSLVTHVLPHMSPNQFAYLLKARYQEIDNKRHSKVAEHFDYRTHCSDIIKALNHHSIVVFTDLEGNILDVNDRFCEVSGYDRSELLGKNHRIVKSDYHDTAFFENLWKTISSGQVWHGDICNRAKNGDCYWINSTIVPILNNKGEPYQYISIRTENTKKKQAELTLQKRFESHQQKQKILLQLLSEETLFTEDIDHALERILTVAAYAMDVDRLSVWGALDDNGVSTSLKNYDTNTKAFEKGHPIRQKKALSKHWAKDSYELLIIPDLKVPELASEFTDHYFQQFDIGAVLGAPVFISGARQGRVVAEMLSKPHEWDVAEQQFIFALSCIVSLMLESNNQRKIAAELSESERRLSESHKFAGIGTWERNIDSGKLRWTDHTSFLFGYSDPITEISFEEFISKVHADDQQFLRSSISICIDNGSEYDVEYRVIWQDGSTHWLHETGNVERDKSGHPIRMLGVVRDITIQQKYEAALVEAREEAEKANRAKSEFLSRMSHELRTPLNSILGFSQLLLFNYENNLTEDQIDNLGEIQKAGKHLLNLVNEVLDLAKIEARQENFQMAPVSPREVMTESLALVTPLFDQRNITIVDHSQEMSDIRVLAEQTRLKQVIVNLLTNASKYAKDGAVVEMGCDEVAENRVRFFVKDNGPGISSNKQKELFQAFNRLGLENSRIEGTGIGLVIAKNIIEQMHGKMGVDSKLGMGSCFWFELRQAHTLSSIDSTNERSVTKAKKLALPEIKNQSTVLYVEDNPANTRLVEWALKQFPSVKLITAHRAQLGLDIAKEKKLNLVLLDIDLPEMDGYQMLAQMRHIPNLSKIPVIAVSGNAMQEDVEKMNGAGFDDVITKPFMINDLIGKIHKHIKAES